MFRKFFAACAALFAVGAVMASSPAAAQTVTTYATFAFSPAGGLFAAGGDYYVSGGGMIHKVTGGGAVVTPYGAVPGGAFANGMVFNTAGDLVFSAEGGGIYRFAAGCVAPCTPILVANTPGVYPQEIAYDAAGNLYYATWTSNRIERLAAGCVEPCTPTVHATGGPINGSPFGLAISAAGVIYVLESDGSVLSIPTACVAPCSVTELTTIPGGIVGGRGLTFDGAGVLYGLSAIQQAVYRIPTDGGVPVSFATDPSFSFPYGFTTGPDGALYTTDNAAARTFRITAAPVPPPTVPTLSEWAVILFGVMLAGGAAVMVQRRRLVA